MACMTSSLLSIRAGRLGGKQCAICGLDASRSRIRIKIRSKEAEKVEFTFDGRLQLEAGRRTEELIPSIR